IIKQIKSFFDKKNSKNRRYLINDFFLAFWFDIFGTEMRNLLDSKIQKDILNTKLPNYFGYAFEKICIVALKNKYEEIESYFRGVEIDILAKNGKYIDVFECKFSDSVKKNTLEKLRGKIAFLPETYNYNPQILYLDESCFKMLFSD
ncbi:MAG: DUF234 domain-containing protein, partial [Nanoarchaeota archaeon]